MTLGCLAVTGMASADCHTSDKCNPCASECCDRWDRGVTAPSAHCATDCDSGFFVGAEALFWKTCRDQLDFAITDTTAGATPYNVGEFQYIDFGYDVGVRAHLGYVPADSDGWDYRATGVYFSTDESATATPPAAPGTLYSTFFTQNPDGHEATSVDAKLDIDYYTVDLTASRPHHVSETLILRPFGGVRVAWFEQDLALTLTGGDFAPDTVRWTSDMWTAGFVGGVESSHKLCDFMDGTFSSFGRCSTSIVYGQADNHYLVAAAATTVMDFKDDMECVMSTCFEGAGGFTWEGCLCDTAVNISVGSEMVKWIGVPVERRLSQRTAADTGLNGTGLGSLGFQGFFVTGGVEF